MKRPEGFYWVRIDSDRWEIAHYYRLLLTYEWFILGDERTYNDADFTEIDERPITREAR